MVEVEIKVGPITETIGIPIITNTKPIKDGEEIVVLKKSSEQEPDVEPAAKRAKAQPPATSARGKGKSKAKAKGKTNSKSDLC